MDFTRPELIAALFAFTLIAVFAIGLWQKRSVKRSQQKHHDHPGASAIDANTADNVRRANPERR